MTFEQMNHRRVRTKPDEVASPQGRAVSEVRQHLFASPTARDHDVGSDRLYEEDLRRCAFVGDGQMLGSNAEDHAAPVETRRHSHRKRKLQSTLAAEQRRALVAFDLSFN